MDFWVRTIPSTLEEDKETGWKVYMLFRASSRLIKGLSCHVGVISAEKIPHPLHQHPEEELILVSSGEVDHILSEGDRVRTESKEHLRKGAIIYIPSHHPHTIRASGPGPTTLLVFKWEGHSNNTRRDPVNGWIIDPFEGRSQPGPSFTNGFRAITLSEKPTHYLQKLRVRLAELEPGASIGWHRDRYDLAIGLLSGDMDTMGVRLEKPAALFITAGTPHWMGNPGKTNTTFLVVEFYRD